MITYPPPPQPIDENGNIVPYQKILQATVTSDANGLFIFSIPQGYFTDVPLVQASAVKNATVVQDLTWATVVLVNSTTVAGYTIRGNQQGILLGGTITSVRLSPTTQVNLMLYGS